MAPTTYCRRPEGFRRNVACCEPVATPCNPACCFPTTDKVSTVFGNGSQKVGGMLGAKLALRKLAHASVSMAPEKLPFEFPDSFINLSVPRRVRQSGRRPTDEPTKQRKCHARDCKGGLSECLQEEAEGNCSVAFLSRCGNHWLAVYPLGVRFNSKNR